MYNSFKISFLVLLLIFPLVSGETCEPYETYSITSILPSNGYAFIIVHHSEWICERVAGEETLRRNMPDGEYDLYYLFNGSDLLFLGKSNPLLDEPSVVAEINGTFYILQRKQMVVPYKNVTMTINGETKNLTLTAKKTEMRVYRFDGCASLIWNCTRLEFQNGTERTKCNRTEILSYFANTPQKSPSGVKGVIENGFIVFRLANLTYGIPVTEFDGYVSGFFGNKTLNVLSTLYALPVGKGILIYYPGDVKVNGRGPASELPLLFFYGGKNLTHLKMHVGSVQEPPGCGDRSNFSRRLTLPKSLVILTGAILMFILVYWGIRRHV
ncbi:hypothetical protein [Thermococcus stetteri]|uniref:hypothetical protein n=1 Tax=Thermococcus stetteri TaxID=49900 RepID=UPI001AE4C955|nr:hypothetical protein [Thermococcus stetteri]